MFDALSYNLQGTGEALLAWRIRVPVGFPPKNMQGFGVQKLSLFRLWTIFSFWLWAPFRLSHVPHPYPKQNQLPPASFCTAQLCSCFGLEGLLLFQLLAVMEELPTPSDRLQARPACRIVTSGWICTPELCDNLWLSQLGLSVVCWTPEYCKTDREQGSRTVVCKWNGLSQVWIEYLTVQDCAGWEWLGHMYEVQLPLLLLPFERCINIFIYNDQFWVTVRWAEI